MLRERDDTNDWTDSQRWALVVGALLAIVIGVTCAHGQAIEGPREFSRDRFARLSAKLPEQWSGTWRFSPRGAVDSVEQPNGSAVLFVAPPGRYVAELLAVGPGTDGRPFSIRAVEHEFTVLESAPGPIPPEPSPPSPVPPNPVPLPSSRFGIVEQVRALSLTVDPMSRPEAQTIAAGYRGIHARITAGEFGDLSTPLNRFIAERISGEMQTKIAMTAAWTKSREALGATVSKLYGDGKLATIADMGVVVSELADGFGGVR